MNRQEPPRRPDASAEGAPGGSDSPPTAISANRASPDKELDPGSLHDPAVMVRDSALADAEGRCDVLAWVAGEHHFHHLDLARRQSLEMRRGPLPPLQHFVRARENSNARSRLAINSSRPIGFSMKSVAPAFIASTAMDTSLFPGITIAGRYARRRAASAAIRAPSCPADRLRSAGTRLCRDESPPETPRSSNTRLDEAAVVAQRLSTPRRRSSASTTPATASNSGAPAALFGADSGGLFFGGLDS